MFDEGYICFIFCFKCHVVIPFPIPTVPQFQQDKNAIKGRLSGLSHFFTTSRHLKMISNAIYSLP